MAEHLSSQGHWSPLAKKHSWFPVAGSLLQTGYELGMWQLVDPLQNAIAQLRYVGPARCGLIRVPCFVQGSVPAVV